MFRSAMFVLIYVLSIFFVSIVRYDFAWDPANTMFVALRCFCGMMELRSGTTTPAILSGGWRSVELHQGRGATSSRATGPEPTDPRPGGRDRRGPSAPQSARRNAHGGRKTFFGGSP